MGKFPLSPSVDSFLREKLLEDLSKEHFAVLLGKTQKINGYTIINIVDLLFPARSDYNHQSVALLRIKKDFIHKALVELTCRYDVGTIIDVHTHPFTQAGVTFSATDDGDEKTFFRFLKKTFEGMHYASIVFSQRKYSARVWLFSSGSIVARKALLKTQTSPENIGSADFDGYTDGRGEILRFAQNDKGERMTHVEVAQVLLKVSPKMETDRQQRSPFHPGWCTFGA